MPTTTRRNHKRPAPVNSTPSLTHFTASLETIDHIVKLVETIRPGWDPGLVRVVLHSHANHVAGADLAIAALRCAADESMPYPKSIGWRGPHWDGLDTMPLDVAPLERCDTCGKVEPRCYSERVGIDDDHAFEPRRPVAR
jgi:hypothetical protein